MMQIHKLFILRFLIILALIGIAVILYKDNFNKTQFNYQKLSSTNLQFVDSANSLKFAYLNIYGIRLPENKDPDLGSIFVISTDGSKVKLAQLDKKIFQKTLPKMIYSPLSSEIIVINDVGIVAVNTRDGKLRNLLNNSDSHFSVSTISSDYRYLYLLTYKTDARGISEAQYYTVDIAKPSQPKPVDFILEQPNFDASTNKVVTKRINTYYTSEAKGIVADTCTFIIHDLALNQTREIKLDGCYNLEFSKNGYSYFFKKELQKIDLKSGKISEADSFPFSKDIMGMSVSRSGRYIFYSRNIPNKHYVYDLSNGSEHSFFLDSSCLSPKTSSWVNYSSGERFIVFNNQLASSLCIYDIINNKLTTHKVPAQLQYIVIDGI